LRKHESFLRHFEMIEKGEGGDLPVVVEEDESTKAETTADRDGAVLHSEEYAFASAKNISPILKTEEEDDAFPDDSIYGFDSNFKRKRFGDDSTDNLSFMSMESTKKPKLMRAGSLTKKLKRRMSFGIVTPINNFIRQRRNSADPNSSNCSTATFNSTFNESIKEPIKEKLRQIKDKVCKLSKKDSTPKSTKSKIRMASANLASLKEVCNIKSPEKEFGAADIFKTPKALPPSFPSTSSARPRCRLDDSVRLNETAPERKLVREKQKNN
jgi:protein ECT2